jgi:hypothetical protein
MTRLFFWAAIFAALALLFGPVGIVGAFTLLALFA